MEKTLQGRIRDRLSYVDIAETQRPAFESLRAKLGVNGPYAFAVAATYGAMNDNPCTTVTRSGKGWARIDDFNTDNGLEMLCMALGQAAGKDVDDFYGCWRTSEEFAAGGIALLQSHLAAPGDFRERFAGLVRQQLDELMESGVIAARQNDVDSDALSGDAFATPESDEESTSQ